MIITDHLNIYDLHTYTYNCISGNTPVYLSSLIKHCNTRVTRFQDGHRLDSNLCKTNYGTSAFVNASPFLWNELPLSVRTSQSVFQFKKLLKTHLFNNYYL